MQRSAPRPIGRATAFTRTTLRLLGPMHDVFIGYWRVGKSHAERRPIAIFETEADANLFIASAKLYEELEIARDDFAAIRDTIADSGAPEERAGLAQLDSQLKRIDHALSLARGEAF